MKSALSFLIAARHCEIDELRRLARTSKLVSAIAELVHALQRERGLSNVFLASGGRRFGAQLQAQVHTSVQHAALVQGLFDQLEAQAPQWADHNGARLFSRIAWVLPGLMALPTLRERVTARAIDAETATAGFVKLIAGLLTVVFEAADGATDPQISRRLGAMFQFMQGKEFAGQERACGAVAFAAGAADAARQRRWLELIAAQERCFQSFAQLAGTSLVQAWQATQPVAELAELERLRRIACASPAGTPLDTDLSTDWFDCCSRRIDAMKQVEDQLAAGLGQLCEHRIADAQAEARTNAELLQRLDAAGETVFDAFFDSVAPEDHGGNSGPTPAIGHQMERSVLDMLQEQSQRLQAVGDELEALRTALHERKLVERAKGLLMAHRKLTEAQAHQMLRQTAMNQSRRLVDVAESVLSMAEYLPGTP